MEQDVFTLILCLHSGSSTEYLFIFHDANVLSLDMRLQGTKIKQELVLRNINKEMLK